MHIVKTQTAENNELLKAALSAVKRGWYILPIWNALPNGSCACPRGTDCENQGKHPLAVLVPHGLTDATTDTDIINGWWAAYPEASLAVVLAPSDLVALDVDSYNNDEEKLQKLVEELGELPGTLEQVSGSGNGAHILFKNPGIPVRGAIGGITVRARSYIVLAPSTHKSGKKYSWDSDPDISEIKDLPPKWVVALSKDVTAIEGIGVIPESEEPDWMKKIDQATRIADMRAHVAEEEPEVMGQSEKGKMFNIARTAARGYGIRDPNVVYDALKEYNEKCIPPYALNQLANRIYSAYETAYKPRWGESLEIHAVLEQTKPVIHAPTEDALRSNYKAAIRRLANTKTQDEQRAHSVLDQVVKYKLGKQPITSTDDVLFTVDTMVKEAASGTESSQIATLLHGLIHDPIAGGEMSIDSLVNFIEGARRRIRPSEAKIPTDDNDLRKNFLKTSDRGIDGSSIANIETLLRYAEALRGKIKWNCLTRTIEIEGGLFAGVRPATLHTALASWFERSWGFKASSNFVGEVLLYVATTWGSYDPAADHLDSPVWDGKDRGDTWLPVYCKTKDSPYIRKIGARWLISAAARGLKPGCKVDTVLILKGRQGLKKSMVFDILGGEWFSSNLASLGDKDSRISAAATWIIELPELAALGQRDLEQNKAFLSSRQDKVRPPYGKCDEVFPRHCVFGATTNADEFLVDETGNRRFWVAEVLSTVDVEALRRDRDQLLAEAVHRYRAGERWWFEGEEELEVEREARKSTVGDAWVDILKTWVERQKHSTASVLGLPAPALRNAWKFEEIAKSALDIEGRDLPRNAKALGKALRLAGFKYKRVHVGGKRPSLWCWEPSDTDDEED